MGMVYNTGTIEERFWQKVKKLSENECWPWLANRNNHGYGLLYWKKYGRKVLAHRVSYEIHIAPLDPKMCVLHKCDNPKCVNPLHLFLGTKRDNTRDMMAKGRKRIGWNPDNKPPVRRGDAHGNSKLTEAQAREIKLSKEPTKALCAKYGVKRDTIKRIRSGKMWRHIVI